MNRLSKRILSCAAAGLIAIPLALFQTGCNPTTTESKTTSDVMGSVVRKYVWYQNIPAGEKAADEYFEKETGAKVERVMVSWDNIDLKFTLDISADTAVDVVYLTEEKFPTYPIKGIVQPLDGLLPADDPLWKSNAMGIYAFGGKHYGIATGISPLLLYYNKTMFVENDVKTPKEYAAEDNWNWDTFAEVAKKLTVTGADGTVQKYGWSTWRFDALMLSNAGSFVDFKPNGSMEVALDSPKTMKALQFMQDAAFTDKWMNPIGNFTWYNDWINGNVAMTCEAAFLFWNGQFDNLKFEYDIAPLPWGPDNTDKIYPGRADASGVCSKARNPQGAIEYIRKTIEYNKLHENDSDAKKSMTEEQFNLNKTLGEGKLAASLYQGIGDLKSKQFGLWDAILSKGTPVATSVATEKPAWEAEIETCLADNKLPEVKPFTQPPKLDFESDETASYLDIRTGDEVGIKAAEVTDQEAIEGKSLLVTCDPEAADGSLVFITKTDKLELPAYHTYKISFDYKLLDDFDEYGALAFCLRPADDPFGGANVGWTEITDGLKAGSTGTLSGEFVSATETDGLSVVCIAQGGGRIVIDNLTITE